MGHLFPDMRYRVVIPQGLLETRDGMESPRIVHVFSTDSVWYAWARFQAVPGGCRGCLSLWFNQAVVFGEVTCS